MFHVNWLQLKYPVALYPGLLTMPAASSGLPVGQR